MKTINGIKMYTSEEVQALLGITQATLTRYRKEGIIRSVYIGRRKYTSDDALREYLNGKTGTQK